MSESNSLELNDLTIDSLVDGTLSHEQYVKLLQQLESQPGGWKKCALGFLEDQALRRELGEIVAADADSTLPNLATREATTPTRAMRDNAQRFWTIRSVGFLFAASAAGFLLALTFGQMLRHQSNDSSDSAIAEHGQREPNGEASSSQPVPPVEMASTERPPSTVTVVFPDPDAGTDHRFEVPIANGNVASADVQHERLSQILSQLGHQAEVKTETITVQDAQGRQFVVPIDRVNIPAQPRSPDAMLIENPAVFQ